MEDRLPLLDEKGSNNGARCMSWCSGRFEGASFRSCLKRTMDSICSTVTSVKEFIHYGNKLALEPLPPYLQIGSTVEMIEADGHMFVEATVLDISISNGMILVKPIHDRSGGNGIFLEKENLRPPLVSSVDSEHHGIGPHPNFNIYARVDVLIRGKWRTWVIIQYPTSNESRYHVRIFREKEKSDFTIMVTTKMRLHLNWDVSRGWNYHAYESNGHPLNQAIGLVGRQRAKVVQMLDPEHAVVEFSDLKNLDGAYVQEVIHIKDWYRSIWARWLKKLRCCLAPTTDPVTEFECYMPVYTSLAMFAAVSSVLSNNSAENWPDNMLAVFYLLGGLCCFLTLLLGVGVMCWKPTTRVGLRIWRGLCLSCVSTGTAFLILHAVYGRQALVASRAKESTVLSV